MRKMVIYTVLILFGIVLVAGLVLVLYDRENTWELLSGSPDLGAVDLATLTRSPKPNDALLCTPGLCGDIETDGDLPAYDRAPEELIAAVETAMRDSEDHIERVDEPGDPARARFVTWTPTMRFPDTTSFIAVPMDDGRTGLAAYARAKLGTSDAGNNLRRLKRVKRRL